MTILTHLLTFVLGIVAVVELQRAPHRRPPMTDTAPLPQPRPAEPKLDGVTDDKPVEPEDRRPRARGFFS